MKISLLFLLLILVGVENPNTSEPAIIVSPNGLTGITLGQSTLEDVVEVYGGQIVKRKQKRVEIQLFGHAEYYVAVDGIGKFETYYPKKGHKVVRQISITGNRCETNVGVRIGSSYRDVIDRMGDAQLAYNADFGTGNKLRMVYGNMTFTFDSELQDSSSCRVEGFTIEYLTNSSNN